MKTIIWDVDDVLNNLTREWFDDFLQRSNSDFSIDYSQLYENPPHRILGISLEKYLESLDEFRIKHGSAMKPREEVLEWFKTHGHKFRHAVLTATPRFYAPHSAQWVISHFGHWIRTYHFVPSKRSTDSFPYYDNNKASFIHHLNNIDLFIDDSEQNVKDVNKSGVDTLLFPQPWNSNSKEKIQDFLQKIIE